MKAYVDLGSKSDVILKAGKVRHVFELDTSHPLYMPVTRDLSPSKREMILKWLGTSDHP